MDEASAVAIRFLRAGASLLRFRLCQFHFPIATLASVPAQVTHDISNLTAADLFRAPGVQTPVIVRFSTVIHERGSPETLRDPRGFAVKVSAMTGAVTCPCTCRWPPNTATPALPAVLHARGQLGPGRQQPAGECRSCLADHGRNRVSGRWCLQLSDREPLSPLPRRSSSFATA